MGIDPQKKVEGTLPSSTHSFLLPSAYLELGSLNPARGYGERCKLHQQGLWGWAPAEIKFGAFTLTNLTCGGND